VWRLWLSWPDLLPLGGGADLGHHLQLIDHIERHWRLVHDARVEAYLGEMVHYTPGVHLLAAIAGRLTGTDGFHAVHPVLALSVALKAGFVFLIALRMLPRDVPRVPLALVARRRTDRHRRGHLRRGPARLDQDRRDRRQHAAAGVERFQLAVSRTVRGGYGRRERQLARPGHGAAAGRQRRTGGRALCPGKSE